MPEIMMAKRTSEKQAKQQLFWCITFLYILLLLLYYSEVKLPHFTFCTKCKHKILFIFFFFWTLLQFSRIQLKKNLAYIWQVDYVIMFNNNIINNNDYSNNIIILIKKI